MGVGHQIEWSPRSFPTVTFGVLCQVEIGVGVGTQTNTVRLLSLVSKARLELRAQLCGLPGSSVQTPPSLRDATVQEEAPPAPRRQSAFVGLDLCPLASQLGQQWVGPGPVAR